MKDLITNLRVGSSRTLLPFQKGILISSNALPMLFADLKTRFGVDYVLTYRLNQDVLEAFFGVIRSIGGLHDHPTAMEFEYRLRKFLLGRNQTMLCQEYAANVNSYPFENSSDSAFTITAELLNHIPDESQSFDDEEDSITNLQHDGIQHIAGYVAYRLRHQENLGKPTSHDNGFVTTWIDELSEGGLYRPGEEFLKTIYKLETIFNKYNGIGLKSKTNYIEGLLEMSSEIEGSDNMKKLFFRCKMYFRMRNMNRNLTAVVANEKKIVRSDAPKTKASKRKLHDTQANSSTNKKLKKTIT